MGQVRYTLECSDNLSREFSSLEDVLLFDNSPHRAIGGFRLSTRAGQSSARISLTNEPYTNLQIALEGPDEVMEPLNREVESRLAAMRPWYALLTRGHVVVVVMGVFFASAILALAWGVFTSSITSSPIDTRMQAHATVLAYGLTAAVFAVGLILHGFRNWLFPVASFALGAGKTRHDFREKIRVAVVIAFALSVASFLGSNDTGVS